MLSPPHTPGAAPYGNQCTATRFLIHDPAPCRFAQIAHRRYRSGGSICAFSCLSLQTPVPDPVVLIFQLFSLRFRKRVIAHDNHIICAFVWASGTLAAVRVTAFVYPERASVVKTVHAQSSSTGCFRYRSHTWYRSAIKASFAAPVKITPSFSLSRKTDCAYLFAWNNASSSSDMARMRSALVFGSVSTPACSRKYAHRLPRYAAEHPFTGQLLQPLPFILSPPFPQ